MVREDSSMLVLPQCLLVARWGESESRVMMIPRIEVTIPSLSLYLVELATGKIHLKGFYESDLLVSVKKIHQVMIINR